MGTAPIPIWGRVSAALLVPGEVEGDCLSFWCWIRNAIRRTRTCCVLALRRGAGLPDRLLLRVVHVPPRTRCGEVGRTVRPLARRAGVGPVGRRFDGFADRISGLVGRYRDEELRISAGGESSGR